MEHGKLPDPVAGELRRMLRIERVLEQSELEPLLAGLVRKEVLGVQSDPRSPERGQYGFLQDLVRHVAYQTLSKRERKTLRVDGTDAVAVYETVRAAIEHARAGEGPHAVEALTLRGHGHAAHDDARYVPAELRAQYPDPLERLAVQLGAEAEWIRRAAEEEVAAGLAEAESAPAPDPATLEDGIYATPLR